LSLEKGSEIDFLALVTVDFPFSIHLLVVFIFVLFFLVVLVLRDILAVRRTFVIFREERAFQSERNLFRLDVDVHDDSFDRLSFLDGLLPIGSLFVGNLHGQDG